MSRAALFGPLCATVFLLNLARVVFAPLLQPVSADFGVTAASLGVIASATWLGSALPRLPTGYLLTRVPRQYVVVATGALLVVTATYTGMAGSISHLTAGAFLMGLSSGMYFIAAIPLVSELYPRRIGRAIGIHGVAEQVAAVSAPLIVGGVLLVTDWRMTFFAIAAGAAVTTMALTVGVCLIDVPRVGAADRSLLVAARVQWPLIVTGVVAIGVIGFLWNGLFNLYGDYLETVKGIAPATSRMLLALMFAAGVPAWLVTGEFADRWPHLPMMAAILVGFGASVVGLTLADGLVHVAVLSVLAGYLFFSLPPVLDTYLLSRLPDRHRGSSYAWYSSTAMIVIAFGSGVVGTVVGRGVAYDAVFQVLAVGVVITGAGLLILYRAGRLPDRTRPSR